MQGPLQNDYTGVASTSGTPIQIPSSGSNAALATLAPFPPKDDIAPVDHRLHTAFRKMAPDQLLEYIRSKLDRLIKEIAHIRSLERSGHNLDIVMKHTPSLQQYARPHDIEANYNHLNGIYNEHAKDINKFANSKMPNKLQQILKIHENVKVYIEALHQLLRDAIDLHARIMTTTTKMEALCKLADEAVANQVLDLTEDIGQ